MSTAKQCTSSTYSNLVFLDVAEIDCNRALARLFVVNVAYSMGREIDVPMLMGRKFVLPKAILSTSARPYSSIHIPLVQAHGILNKKEQFVRQQLGSMGSSQVHTLKEHSGPWFIAPKGAYSTR